MISKILFIQGKKILFHKNQLKLIPKYLRHRKYQQKKFENQLDSNKKSNDSNNFNKSNKKNQLAKKKGFVVVLNQRNKKISEILHHHKNKFKKNRICKLLKIVKFN